MWWLDHYAAFGQHLDGQYRRIAQTDDCLIYELAEQLSGAIVSSLLPAGAALAIASPFQADAYGFADGFEAEPIVLGDDPDEALREIDAAIRRGVRYLVLPKTAFPWLERNPEAADRLRSEHRLVTRQQHACEIYELAQREPERLPAAGEPDAQPAGPGGADHAAGAGRTSVEDEPPARARGPLARLLWGRAEGEPGSDG
jgi:hypothetical protein